MNLFVITNFARLKGSVFVVPVLFLLSILLFLYIQNALNAEDYTAIQKDSFYQINHFMGQYSSLLHNLTALGDALVSLSLLSGFVTYAPKLWEALVPSLLLSLLFSVALKKTFAVPRPAAAFGEHSFVVIGSCLKGHNSLPSGHAIVVFTLLTVLLFAFMPQLPKWKWIWSISILSIGAFLVFTRVGVGAHFPLDVLIGSGIGFLCALLGIFFIRKFKLFSWIGNRKYTAVFFVLFLFGSFSLVYKILKDHLLVYYLALLVLACSLLNISFVSLRDLAVYAKK